MKGRELSDELLFSGIDGFLRKVHFLHELSAFACCCMACMEAGLRSSFLFTSTQKVNFKKVTAWTWQQSMSQVKLCDAAKLAPVHSCIAHGR